MNMIDEIFRLLDVATEEEAVQAVKDLKHAVTELNGMIASLTVATVIMANGKAIFVQMPPTVPLTHYAPEALESVQDALIDSSVGLRGALVRSRKRLAQAMEGVSGSTK